MDLVPFKKYAVGYDSRDVGEFIRMIEPYLPTIKEVYFSWPGMATGRNMAYIKDISNATVQLMEDLTWCKSHGLSLDLLFNGNCYGEDFFSETLRNRIYEVLAELKANDLFPEVVTTTSQFIAKVIKNKYPEIDIRASVNMRIESTRAFEYIADIFDSLYICRDFQRDRNFLKQFHDWCQEHGKKLCMLVNSACLRCCPIQIFHDNSLCHNNFKTQEQEFILRFPMRLCGRVADNPKFRSDFLKMSWIRPEDIHFYGPYVSAMKLATRDAPNPELMLKAYAQGHYEGDLLDCIGAPQADYCFDNTAFPSDWVESGIAQNCAINCTNCGKCDEVLRRVLRQKESPVPVYSFTTKNNLKID